MRIRPSMRAISPPVPSITSAMPPGGTRVGEGVGRGTIPADEVKVVAGTREVVGALWRAPPILLHVYLVHQLAQNDEGGVSTDAAAIE